MNEQDKRTIYEWLYEELKGTGWKLMPTTDGKGRPMDPIAQYEAARRTFAKLLLPLDMNTWHGPVAEKLKAEGVSVVTVQYTPNAGGVDGKPYACSIDCAAAGSYDGVGATADDACYSALLDYIKEVRE